VRPHLAKGEIRYLGKKSCAAVFEARPEDIIRFYVVKNLEKDFQPILNFCKKNRRSYHIVNDNDLEKLTDSTHHEGVCVVAKEKPLMSEAEFWENMKEYEGPLLFLDRIGNPHNQGAIFRTAAHFGIPVVATNHSDFTRISPAAHRTSEGGAEFLEFIKVKDEEFFMDRLNKLGFKVFTLEVNKDSQSIFDTAFPLKSVFIMGSEVEGVSKILSEKATKNLHIDGSGNVESLNVSVATAITLAEFFRQQKKGNAKITKEARSIFIYRE